MAHTLTIGKLAKAAGVGVETVRYYHRCGLLPVPERVNGTIRQYTQPSLKRIFFIRRAQSLGFTLDEIRVLLQQSDGDSCSRARVLAERKLGLVEQRLRDLERLRAELTHLIGQCKANGDEASCPLIETLSDSTGWANARDAPLRP
ncbi:MerR family DNA-binding protein [Cupriavidus sp. WKF15]|uniref:MerR family transcriptional regulator n=1 Tax=Cupriavidus sp. WKF15 TaxID=3032282 RepID=UPI0023E222BA|nr:MerR family DNA-binding protein [Cupriavidus sp. WKF15]WER49279.1 MerR family DNA-binding protein [Cupriavidus sp. WKF15]